MTTENQSQENTQLNTNQIKENRMDQVAKVDPKEVNQVKASGCQLTYQPNLDIVELEKGVELLFDMPGIEKSDVSIKLERNQLSVLGTSGKQSAEVGTLVYQEFKPGNYARTVELSSELDKEKIEANFDQGVLRVFLPKRDEVIPQSITIH